MTGISEEQLAEWEGWAKSAQLVSDGPAANMLALIAEVRRLQKENKRLTRLVGDSAADAALHGAKIGGDYKRRRKSSGDTTQWDTP